MGVERDRISAIGTLDPLSARRVVDARGLLVTPGLIDGHTHSSASVHKPGKTLSE